MWREEDGRRGKGRPDGQQWLRARQGAFLSVVRIDEMLEESGMKKNVRGEREIVFV